MTSRGANSIARRPYDAARRRSAKSSRRRGIILVIVLVVVAVLALAGYTFCELMLRNKEAVLLRGRQIQSQAIVESGVESVKQFLAQGVAGVDQSGGIFNNPNYFQGITVVDDKDSGFRGKFTVLSPFFDEQSGTSGIRYGLEDESIRLNLNVLIVFEKVKSGSGKSIVMAVPGMTEEIADAILDWMDSDDEPRQYGAEVEYYSQLSPPYRPKNGPLETVEELLLVRGITPQILFGADVNRNGVIDQNEMTAQQQLAPIAEAATGLPNALDRGWLAYLTLYSQERNINSQGNPRININGQDLAQLNDQLLQVFNQEWANFIIAYRQNGPQAVQGGAGQSASSGTLDLSQQGGTKFSQVLDLVGAQTQAKFSGAPQPVPLNCPFPNDPLAMATYLPLLMDNLTISDAQVVPGRININHAPPAILAGIPGMSQDIARKIVEQRQAAMQDTEKAKAHMNETWILAEGLVTLTEMRALIPFITGGGHRYRAQVVGYFQTGGGATRSEIIFDASQSPPSVLFWRDISHLGRGYTLEKLGMDLDVGTK